MLSETAGRQGCGRQAQGQTQLRVIRALREGQVIYGVPAIERKSFDWPIKVVLGHPRECLRELIGRIFVDCEINAVDWGILTSAERGWVCFECCRIKIGAVLAFVAGWALGNAGRHRGEELFFDGTKLGGLRNESTMTLNELFWVVTTCVEPSNTYAHPSWCGN